MLVQYVNLYNICQKGTPHRNGNCLVVERGGGHQLATSWRVYKHCLTWVLHHPQPQWLTVQPFRCVWTGKFACSIPVGNGSFNYKPAQVSPCPTTKQCHVIYGNWQGRAQVAWQTVVDIKCTLSGCVNFIVLAVLQCEFDHTPFRAKDTWAIENYGGKNQSMQPS
jgi:hypothetical protein